MPKDLSNDMMSDDNMIRDRELPENDRLDFDQWVGSRIVKAAGLTQGNCFAAWYPRDRDEGSHVRERTSRRGNRLAVHDCTETKRSAERL